MNRLVEDPDESNPNPDGEVVIDPCRLTPLAVDYFRDVEQDETAGPLNRELIQVIAGKVREYHGEGMHRASILANVAKAEFDAAEMTGNHELTDPELDRRLAFIVGVARQVLADLDPGHDGRFPAN